MRAGTITSLRATVIGCALFLGIAAGNRSAEAITLDFDAGYTANALLENTPSSGTKWTRSANVNDNDAAMQVVSSLGVDRQQAVITRKSSDAAVTYANYYFSPSAADLAGTFSAGSSIINYSFSVAMQANPGSYTGNVTQMAIGNLGAAYFWVTGDGRVTASLGDGNQGKTPVVLKTTKGGTTNFVALGGVYFTLSGQVNFAKKTFTVFLDGVQQTTGDASATTDFPFVTNSCGSPLLSISNQNATNSGWVPVTYSHLFYELDPTWEGPVVITTGGTYSNHNWASTDPTTAVVRINTTQPVTLEHCRIKGTYALISSSTGAGAGSNTENVNLTVDNCKGYGLNPNVKGQEMPQFLCLYSPKSVTVTNCYMESTESITIYGGSPQQLNLSNNYDFNNDERVSDGAGGYLIPVNGQMTISDGNGGQINLNRGRSCFGINHCSPIANGTIAWNKFVQVPNESWVSDTICILSSGGTLNTPIQIYDNYIQGSYYCPVDASNAGNATNSSTGVNAGDGPLAYSSPSGNPVSAYTSAHDNVVVNIANVGVAIYEGHDHSMTNNRVYSTGFVGLGTPARKSNGAGLTVMNLYNEPTTSSWFFNQTVTGNMVGYVNANGNAPSAGSYDYDFTNKNGTTAYDGVSSNTWYTGTTTADEQTASNYFYQQVQSNGINIGPNW